jgi:hypothetical protein
MSIRDREQLHVATRALEREQPAADLLARLTPPPGVAQCDPSASVTTAHMLCWEGDADIVATTSAVAAGLRTLGAIEVSPRCGELRFTGHPSMILCQVKADVLGQPFSVSLGPGINRENPTAKFRGVFVSGGVGVGAAFGLRIPSRAVPIPVPEVPNGPPFQTRSLAPSVETVPDSMEFDPRAAKDRAARAAAQAEAIAEKPRVAKEARANGSDGEPPKARPN